MIVCLFTGDLGILTSFYEGALGELLLLNDITECSGDGRFKATSACLLISFL